MDAFRETYPTLCELLACTAFEADATNAVAFAKVEEDLKEALMGRVFELNELMWLLCGAVVPAWANFEAIQLENDLAAVVGSVGIDIARSAYKEKFLVESKSKIKDPKAKVQDAKNKLEDVRYEVAVTAKACGILDACSIQLEKPIRDPSKKEKDWKNSDVYGTFQGQPVRIEVTVLHETLPPAIHLELDDLVRQAKVESGFRITLRSTLVDQGYAERVRALVELLYDNHKTAGGVDVEVDSVRFEWKKGAYHCPQETSPFDSICFYAADEFTGAEEVRDIVHPCSVRPVTSKHVLEDNPNPPGVITSADLPDAPTQAPVSTKVGQMLAGKLQQCEGGSINIVAFGNPLPMHDREVVSAVRGSEFVAVPFWTDKHGVLHSGKAAPLRDPKAPFVPPQYLPNDDDRTQFIEPFLKMSAVWHIRIGGYAKSQIIPNPNALMPIPTELVKAWTDPLPPPTPKTAEEQPDLTTSAREEQTDESDQEEGIVWADVAQNYVEACGTIAEARSILAKLEQAGISFDELRAKVEELWSDPPREAKNTKFISPTDEDMAMTFVVDCGGYEQAKACLEAYSEETGGNDRHDIG